MAQIKTSSMLQKAEKNIHFHTWINFLSGCVFLIPVITLLYQHTGLGISEIILISNVGTLTNWLLELPTSVFADTAGRKKSLVISAIASFIAALIIIFFPSFLGFVAAAITGGIALSFWSGTGQAFLEENLRTLGREQEFGKKIGHFMALEQGAQIITPLIASAILGYFGNQGYTLLAILDGIFTGSIIILTLKLRDLQNGKRQNILGKTALQHNINTAKDALKNVFGNPTLRLIILYRSLSNHVSFLLIISLPLLVGNGMPEWGSGIITTLMAIAIMITSKYTYKLGELKSYEYAWVLSTTVQAGLLIVAGFLTQSWITFAVLLILFNFFEGIWRPAWNHVLVTQTHGKAIATTRSIVFSVFALYTTLGKQLLASFTIENALIFSGFFILIVNMIFAKKILALHIPRRK